MINKKKYTLVLLKDVKYLFNAIQGFVELNSDILELIKNEPFEIKIADKSKYSDFEFSISEPTQRTDDIIIYSSNYNPSEETSLAIKNLSATADLILTHFEHWVSLIRTYNATEISEEESIINEYEQEFYTSFEIVDEDADKKPYELEKQVVIHNYLVNVILILKENEHENAELIEEAEEIKDNITSMTKRTTVKRISLLFAKVRKKSLPLLKEVLELGRKELFKKGIKFLIDNISDWVALIG